MREEYPWMHEFLRSFTWTYQRPENGIKVSYKGSYDEILAKTENPGSAEKNNRKEILSDITAGLQFIFGKYWNPGCMERLKTVHRKADEVDENHVRTPFEAMDERERFLDLINRLNFIGLYTNYRIVRDDLTPENEPVKKVQNLLHDIRTADPKKDPLSDETVDRIRTYFRKFAEEFSPYLKDSTDSNAFGLILYNMLTKTYSELKQKKQEVCEANGTEYKPGETFAAFSEEADGAGEVLRKWYDRLDKKARQSPPLDILVYDRAFRNAVKAAEEDGLKRRGRKKRTDSVPDEAVLKETIKNRLQSSIFAIPVPVGSAISYAGSTSARRNSDCLTTKQRRMYCTNGNITSPTPQIQRRRSSISRKRMTAIPFWRRSKNLRKNRGTTDSGLKESHPANQEKSKHYCIFREDVI